MSSVKYTCKPHKLLQHNAMDLGLRAPALKVKAASFRITKLNDAARNEYNILTAVCIETGRLQCLLGYQLCQLGCSRVYQRHTPYASIVLMWGGSASC